MSTPMLTIGAVSQATGIPVPTLRTWERRYFPTFKQISEDSGSYSWHNIAPASDQQGFGQRSASKTNHGLSYEDLSNILGKPPQMKN